MAGYTKLFSSILMSSIWEENTDTRIVWVTLLALADQDGHVDGTVHSVARVARVSVEACQSAMDTFLNTDPLDRSGVMDGQRVIAEHGGWTLVNYNAYRHRMSEEDRKERDRIRQAKYRMSRVTSPDVTEIRQAEAEAEADTKAKAKAKRKNVSSATVENTVTEPAVLTFSTVGTPSEWHLTQTQIDAWSLAFPQTDVLGEARKALAWLEANNRKTSRGMPAFLVRWLGKAANGPTGASPTKAQYQSPYKYAWMDPANDGKLGEQE